MTTTATRCLALLIAAALPLAAPRSARGQERSFHFDLQPWHGVSTSGGLFTLEGTEIGTHLRPRGSVQLTYYHEPLIYAGLGGEDIAAVRTRLGAEVALSMGLFNRVELGLALPVVIHQSGQETPMVGEPATAGIGDLRLVPKVRLLGRGLRGLSLALTLGARIPTAKETALAGAGGAFEPGVTMAYRRGSLQLHGALGYRLQGERRLLNLVVDDELLLGVGASYRHRALAALAEVTVATAAAAPFGERRSTPVQSLFGARYTLGGLTFTAGLGPGLVPGYGAPTVQVMAGVGYAPWGIDADGDRIPDDADGCPLEPEDRDGFEDADGCPDLDNDRDGLPDGADRCPLEAEDRDGFEDADGCPDPDNDRDQVPDGSDRCPLEPEDRDGFEDADGCPDPDNDRDGILDKDDKCPNQAETLNGIDDADGCPEPDRDKDGILDKDDKCLDQPEDKNGIEDTDGCPDDPDGDKIIGEKDQCPLEPETVNGYHDDDGCPDEAKPRVEFREAQLWTSEAIFFDRDKWIIKGRFRHLLRKVAEAIIDNNKIRVVYVEGHADGQGSDMYNQWLSFYRAEEVLLALRRLGVPRTRIRAMGRGSDLPQASNATDQGMAENRRVIFHVEYKKPREKGGAP